MVASARDAPVPGRTVLQTLRDFFLIFSFLLWAVIVALSNGVEKPDSVINFSKNDNKNLITRI